MRRARRVDVGRTSSSDQIYVPHSGGASRISGEKEKRQFGCITWIEGYDQLEGDGTI